MRAKASMDECEHRFSEEERRGLYRAIYERRDVRSFFKPAEIPDDVLARLLDAAHHAPSVGLMQPWGFIVIRDRDSPPNRSPDLRSRSPRCSSDLYG